MLRVWSTDCRLRARTKQFIEFGLKISFTPCNFLKNTCKFLHIEFSNSNNYAVQCRSQWGATLLWRCATSNTQRYYTISNFKISLFSDLPGLPVVKSIIFAEALEITFEVRIGVLFVYKSIGKLAQNTLIVKALLRTLGQILFGRL